MAASMRICKQVLGSVRASGGDLRDYGNDVGEDFPRTFSVVVEAM